MTKMFFNNNNELFYYPVLSTSTSSHVWLVTHFKLAYNTDVTDSYLHKNIKTKHKNYVSFPQWVIKYIQVFWMCLFTE